MGLGQAHHGQALLALRRNLTTLGHWAQHSVASQTPRSICNLPLPLQQHMGLAGLRTLPDVLSPPALCPAQIVKSMPNYTQAARDEVALLNLIRDIAAACSGESGCVKLLDAFEHPGPQGTHVCEIFEIMGDDLLMLMRSGCISYMGKRSRDACLWVVAGMRGQGALVAGCSVSV